MRILIVDDDSVICENVQSKINRIKKDLFEDIQTAAAYSAAEAESVFEKGNFDILITDINMPSVSGLDLIHRIRIRDKKCKIYVLSGYDDYEFVRRAFLAGADDYLLKPVDIEELREKVFSFKKIVAKPASVQAYSSLLMQKALEYIEENLTRNISMEETAKNIGVSYNYFSSLFKDCTGLHFPEYVNKRRSDFSKRYLADPSVRIIDIAHKTGYDSASSYSKAFKKYENVSPSGYRDILAGKNTDT